MASKIRLAAFFIVALFALPSFAGTYDKTVVKIKTARFSLDGNNIIITARDQQGHGFLFTCNTKDPFCSLPKVGAKYEIRDGVAEVEADNYFLVSPVKKDPPIFVFLKMAVVQ